MTNLDIARQRLHNQHIAGIPLATPEDVVRWLGAVQAQDYAAAKWAVAQRTGSLTDAAMDQAFADGTILRTHVLRPTWHFVTPADIRWMLALTAPRVHAFNAYYYRKMALDDAIFAQSNAALAKALQGGTQLTRSELVSVLQQAGIATDALLRFGLLLMRAELDGIICSGARRGKQFTYALLDERAPRARTLERDEALAELAGRYFTSHGPATLKDYLWWSGLTATDAKRGIEMVKPQLISEIVDSQTYWFAPSTLPVKNTSLTASLLPNFDEYTVGYRDRSAVYDARHTETLDARGDILSHHTMAIDGQIVGTWKRTQTKSAVAIEATPFTPLSNAEMHALTAAAERYGAFLHLPVHFRLRS
ncbi:MAG: winged helix DNA-binding domain-containing protein [Chloroflexota bacterium]|nr:winged helix DNA-binding domain-containing protein [Chloroflexota bacterium]